MSYYFLIVLFIILLFLGYIFIRNFYVYRFLNDVDSKIYKHLTEYCYCTEHKTPAEERVKLIDKYIKLWQNRTSYDRILFSFKKLTLENYFDETLVKIIKTPYDFLGIIEPYQK